MVNGPLNHPVVTIYLQLLFSLSFSAVMQLFRPNRGWQRQRLKKAPSELGLIFICLADKEAIKPLYTTGKTNSSKSLTWFD